MIPKPSLVSLTSSLRTSLVLCALLYASARAGTMSASLTPPEVVGDDIANYGEVNGSDKWWLDSNAGAKGQTFRTPAGAALLRSITYQITESQKAEPTKQYTVRLGTVAGSTFTPVYSETFTQSETWNAGEFMTWAFTNAPLLNGDTTYAVDVGMTSSTSGWTTGIPYINTTANEYTGGQFYTSGNGAPSVDSTTMSLAVNSDRIFHLDIEAPSGPVLQFFAGNPPDNSTAALIGPAVVATFNQNLAAGAGDITIRNLTDSTDVSLPVGDSRITLSANLLKIATPGLIDWNKSYAIRIDPGAITGNGGTAFAGIADDSTWNFTTAVADPLLVAVAAIKNHINNSPALNAADLAIHSQTLNVEAVRFADNATNIAAVLDLVKTFDTVKGPLWVAPAASSLTRSTENNDLTWTIFRAMQAIMDRIYTAETLANHESLLNDYKFGSRASFPGNCAPPADPNVTHTATISGSYANTVGRSTQGDGPGTFARKPTGCYLAPGSIATVTVPAALVGAGYKIRVGAQSWDHSARPNTRRLDRATVAYSINALETKIANPLGGGIYIEVPFLANAGVVSIQIRNAVRSPFFSVKPFHTTTPTQWLTERAHPAPWADFQSEKFMMQVPTSWISAMPDPTQLMADWDTAMDAVNDLMGFPRIRGKEAFYTQVDLQLKNSVFAPGYPSVNVGGFNATGNYGGYNNHYLVRGPQYGIDANIEFHEQGHGYFFPKFGGESESVVNLLYVPAMEALGMPLEQAFRQSVTSGNTYQTLDTTAIAWMCTFNFSPKEQPMQGLEKQYQLKGHAKFVDISRLFGWSGLNAFWASFVQDEENGVPLPSGTDAMLLRLCQSVGKDIRPLFHFWGVPPENPTTLASAIAAAGIPSAPEIRDRLLYYKTLVPANNAAFRTFATAWWGRKPLISGLWEETDHAMQWDETPDADGGSVNANVRPNGDIYVEATATDIRGRAQELVDLYFPDANPPVLTTLSPADETGGVELSSNLTATFSESIARGTGNITLKNLTDGTQTVIAVTDTAKVSFAGAILTINPAVDLLAGKTYAILIDAGAVKDLSNVVFAGITDETIWNFTTTAPDLTPPTPDPLTWASVPQAISQSAITMTATTATDVSGVEYFFECTSGGGSSSAWQSSATFTATGLAPNSTYAYRVRARDKSLANNATGFSAEASATTAQVGTFSSTTTAPVVNGADIANLGAQTSNDKWFFQSANEVDTTDWAKGQTFTTGASPVLLKALTYKNDPTTKKAATTTYTVRVGTLSGNNFTTVARAVCAQTADTATGAYMTWTFGIPVALAPNTTYAIDVAMVSGVAFSTGIPYLSNTGNSYAGGQSYNSGISGGSGSGPTISPTSSVDRVFHLDLDAVDATPPALTANAIVDDQNGGPITAGALVTYTVTFSEDMDDATVSAADFGNAGNAVIAIGTVTETAPGVFTVPVTASSVGTLHLKVIAGADLKDAAGNALSTTTAIADDTILTVNPDTTAPTPNPLTWASVPTATGPTTITMTATPATDIGGVEYFFECTAGGGSSSGWQSSATFTAIGLIPNTTYSYRVRARDMSPANNTTGFSPTASATTPEQQANTGTGGTITYTDSNGLNPVAFPPYNGGYVVHRFNSNGTLSLPVPVSADVLVVGGGGGGAMRHGGGGGAGAYVFSSAVPLGSGSTSVTVGNGGAGANSTDDNLKAGSPGGNSVFGSIIAAGGGGGRTYGGSYNGAGGSGGGGSGGGSNPTGGTGIAGQGFNGGSGSSGGNSGAGGGGAGQLGAASSSASGGGKGGDGVQSSISGIATYYAGGGGGGGDTSKTGGIAGLGGGGRGGDNGVNTNQTAGVNGTGGGGGGCRSATTTAPGSAGGSGIVIVRYPYVPGSFSITLDSPTNNQSLGSAASVSATASVIGGVPTHTVKFYLDSNLVSTTNSAPSTVTVDLGALPSGSHTLYATATDVTTATVTSATHTFTVADSGGYADWSGGTAFGHDTNNDGVSNGLAWLLGAAGPAADATALLPKAANEAGKLVLTFRCLKTSQRGTAALKLQFTHDLGLADPWTSHEALVPDVDGTHGGVVFVTTADADPAFINIRAEIPASAASPTGRLFGRLSASNN